MTFHDEYLYHDTMRMRPYLVFTGTGQQAHVDAAQHVKPASIRLTLQFWYRDYNIFVIPRRKK